MTTQRWLLCLALFWPATCIAYPTVYPYEAGVWVLGGSSDNPGQWASEGEDSKSTGTLDKLPLTASAFGAGVGGYWNGFATISTIANPFYDQSPFHTKMQAKVECVEFPAFTQGPHGPVAFVSLGQLDFLRRGVRSGPHSPDKDPFENTIWPADDNVDFHFHAEGKITSAAAFLDITVGEDQNRQFVEYIFADGLPNSYDIHVSVPVKQIPHWNDRDYVGNALLFQMQLRLSAAAANDPISGNFYSLADLSNTVTLDGISLVDANGYPVSDTHGLYLLDSNDVSYNVQSIPEPASSGGLVAGLFCASFFVRRTDRS